MIRQVHAYGLPRKPLSFALRPALAWLAILGLVAFTALCILIHAGSLIRLTFPLGSFAVGILLYRRYPILYLGFTWWLWLLTPWVRRLIDYQSSWVNPSPVLLAPYLVTSVTLITFIQHFPSLCRQDGLPFVLSCAGVLYGFLIGLVNSLYGIGNKLTFLNEVLKGFNTGADFTYTLAGVLVSTLDWITPILLSCHLFINWQYYLQYRQNIQRTFCWGVLLTGAYGVLQYLVAPEWDRFWLKNVIAIGGDSFGSPEPLGIRVFSTMNAPGPYAGFMMAGLLLLLNGKGVLRLFASTVGYLAFLLTLVRTAWGGWFLGVLILSMSLKQRTQMRLFITLLVIGICAFSLTTVEPFSEVINARFQTLGDVQQDGSFQARTETYQKAFEISLLEVLGNGFGLPKMDSALIDMLFAMGWIGVIPYFGGVILLALRLWQSTKKYSDPFISAASAISLGTLATLALGNPLTEVSGVILWGFQGVALAGQKYYEHQRAIQIEGG